MKKYKIKIVEKEKVDGSMFYTASVTEYVRFLWVLWWSTHFVVSKFTYTSGGTVKEKITLDDSGIWLIYRFDSEKDAFVKAVELLDERIKSEEKERLNRVSKVKTVIEERRG